MMSRDKYVYPYSFEEAKRIFELEDWKVSHKQNIECKQAIENALAEKFNGMHLDGNIAESLCKEFGIERMKWVLSNTVQHAMWDSRYRYYNKDWAKETFIPKNKTNDVTAEFSVNSHPELVNGLIDQFKRYYDSLNLFNSSHCEENSSSLDFENRVLVLNPCILKDEYKTPENQLFYANIGGFGCSPGSYGKVMGVFLIDGEKTNYHRNDFIGVLKDEFFPDWVAEKLAKIQSLDNSEGMTMGGI